MASTSATSMNPTPTLVRRQNAPEGALPGSGYQDPYLDALVQAADAIQACPDDVYSADIKAACMSAHNALQRVRTMAWQANDALLVTLGGAKPLVQANIANAKAAIPSSGFGSPVDRQAAVNSAGFKVAQESTKAAANAVFDERSTDADEAAFAFATALQDASATVALCAKEYVGPITLRRDFTSADWQRCDALEQEIGRSGLVWASEYLSAAVGKKPVQELFIFCAAALRVVQNVRTEPAPKRAVRLPSQGNAAAGAELDASYQVWNQVDAWLASVKPASLAMGAQVLTILTSVGAELCGPGNLARLTIGQFESAFLNPDQARKTNAFQARSGWLLSWLPPRGQCPPGFSPQAGRANMGAPFRFGKGDT